MESEKLAILKNILGYYRINSNEYLFKCPNCDHYKNKFSINLNKGVYKCWLCDYKGTSLSKLVKHRGTYQQYKEFSALASEVDISSFDELFTSSEEFVEEQNLELPSYFCSFSSLKESETGMIALQYLLDRGFTKKEIILYKLGFCFHGPYKGRIVVPSFDDQGRINYFVGRSFDNHPIKYKNPSASKDIIFNDLYIDWTQPVTLVEGFFDSVKIDNSIPILGSTLNTRSKLFNKIVENGDKVFICLDKDAAKKESKIIKNFLDFGVKVCKIDIGDNEDPGTMTRESALQAQKDAAVIDYETYLLQKLNFGGF